MPIKFDIQSFPSLVILEKSETLTKDRFSEGEYEILTKFVSILQPILDNGEESIDPLSLINIVFDERGSVTAIYGPSIGKNETSDGLIVQAGKVQYPIEFRKDEGVFFNGIKIMPILTGKEYERNNSEKKKVKIQPCAGLIDSYQLNISIDIDNPFTQNEQISFMSGFMMGEENHFESFLHHVSFPKLGGGKIRPNAIDKGVYLITGFDLDKDKFGESVNLNLKSLLNGEEVKTFSCSYFKEKFIIFNSAAIKSDRKLYLIVDEPKDNAGKSSFNGSFSFNPQPYLDKFSATK
jgi:hypothetical protein